MTINARLDEIAKQCALDMLDSMSVDWDIAHVRAALDKAIELVLTAEPSEKQTTAGFMAQQNYEAPMSGEQHCSRIYRAMSSALLEEIKNETPGS